MKDREDTVRAFLKHMGAAGTFLAAGNSPIEPLTPEEVEETVRDFLAPKMTCSEAARKYRASAAESGRDDLRLAFREVAAVLDTFGETPVPEELLKFGVFKVKTG